MSVPVLVKGATVNSFFGHIAIIVDLREAHTTLTTMTRLGYRIYLRERCDAVVARIRYGFGEFLVAVEDSGASEDGAPRPPAE